MTPEEREHIRQELPWFIIDTVVEWLNRITIELEGSPHEGMSVRINWEAATGADERPSTIATLSESGYGDEFGRYGVTVTVETLPDPPPELFWYPRTYADVRVGDTIKHTETAPEARVLSCSQEGRHVRDGGTGRHWDDGAIEHDLTRVRLDYPGGDPERILDIPAATPVLIQLAAAEYVAIELLGWDNRIDLDQQRFSS